MGSLSPQALNNVSLAEEATKRVHSRQCGTVLQRRDLLRLGLVGAGLSHQGRCVAGEVEEAVARSQVQKPVPVGMSILTVKRSVPATTIKDFQRLVGRANQVKIKTKKDLREVYKELRTGKTSGVDLVTIGDAWMTNAIQNKYIQPLADADKYRYLCDVISVTTALKDTGQLAAPTFVVFCWPDFDLFPTEWNRLPGGILAYLLDGRT